MKYSEKEILRIIEQRENITVDFKESEILQNSTHLAETMASMSNSEGGLILIGVRDDGSIEGMKFKKGHEEQIMNIAVNNISPQITPDFEVVNFEKGVVYVLTIPKRKSNVRHGVKIKGGFVYKKRVGSRTTDIPPEELSSSKIGVEVKPQPFSFNYWAGRKLLEISQRFNISFQIMTVIIRIFGLIVSLIGFLLIFRFENWMLTIVSGYTNVTLYSAISLMLSGILLFSFAESINTFEKKTRCPHCGSPFSYKKVSRFVTNKRRMSRELEEWTCRNTYRCDVCKAEETKMEFEKHEIPSSQI